MRVEQDSQNLLLTSQGGLSKSNMALNQDMADLPQKQKGIDLTPLIRTIRRNILLISGIATVAAAAATYFSMTAERSYQGSFRVLVEPITSQARFADPSTISRDRPTQTFPLQPDTIDYPTLLQVLQSPTILSKIAVQIQSRYPDVTADSLLEDLQEENLGVKRLDLVAQRLGANLLDSTKVIEVSYKGADPQKVQFILEELSRGYLRYSLEDRKTRIGGGVQFIEDQLPSLQQRVNSLESDLQTLKQRYRLTDPTIEGQGLSNQLQAIRTQKLETQRNLAEQQTLYTNLQRQLGFTPQEALAAASLSQNTSYQALLTEYKKIEAQIAIKAARFSEESPVLKGLLDQRSNLAQLLTQEAQRNLGQNSSATSFSPRVLGFQDPLRLDLIKQMITAANMVQQLQVRDQAITQAETFLDQQLQRFPVAVRQYTDLQQRLELARNTLNQFLTQRETLRIEAAQTEVPWEIIAAPNLVRDNKGNLLPSSNSTLRNMIMGLVAGALLGLILAVLKEKRTDVYYGVKDLQNAVHIPLLGVIPFKNNLNQVTNPLTGSNSDSFSRAFNSVYTSIRFISSDPLISSVVVSSASVGDGKTTVALHLALEAASMGQRVLLVDANLRSPQLHTALGLLNSTGLSEVLTGQVELEEVIQRPQLSKNLSVLTAGQSLLESSRLVASHDMRSLMHQLHTKFDLVIYDTPNLSEFSDTKFLAAHADGILMVVGIAKTKRFALTAVLAELHKFHLPVLGITPNHTGRRNSISRDRNGQYGQGYGGQSTRIENLKLPGISTSMK